MARPQPRQSQRPHLTAIKQVGFKDAAAPIAGRTRWQQVPPTTSSPLRRQRPWRLWEHTKPQRWSRHELEQKSQRPNQRTVPTTRSCCQHWIRSGPTWQRSRLDRLPAPLFARRLALTINWPRLLVFSKWSERATMPCSLFHYITPIARTRASLCRACSSAKHGCHRKVQTTPP
jgi:hypothetical protein